MSEEKCWKPGQVAEADLTLGVIGSSGEEIGCINVKKGETIPPYRSEKGVEKYIKK